MDDISRFFLAAIYSPTVEIFLAARMVQATVVSGLFELDPLRDTYANDWLSLDEAAARRNSPLHHLPRAGLPLLVSVGGQETKTFRDQTRTYAETCAGAGVDVTYFERPDANHLSIIGEFAEPESPLFQALEKRVLPDGA